MSDIIRGMSAQNGRRIDGLDHLRQSVSDILTTPKGTRVERRDYGSDLFDLIDQPGNPVTRQRMIAASADAIQRWEPRVRITRVGVGVAKDGRAEIRLEGETTDSIFFNDAVVIGGAA